MEGGVDQVVGTSYTNDIGEVEFLAVPMGEYHVRVSGDGVETTDSPTFDVDNRKVTQSQYVTVRQLAETGPKPLSSHSTMVSASDLNTFPKKARKQGRQGQRGDGRTKLEKEKHRDTWRKPLPYCSAIPAHLPTIWECCMPRRMTFLVLRRVEKGNRRQ